MPGTTPDWVVYLDRHRAEDREHFEKQRAEDALKASDRDKKLDTLLENVAEMDKTLAVVSTNLGNETKNCAGIQKTVIAPLLKKANDNAINISKNRSAIDKVRGGLVAVTLIFSLVGALAALGVFG